MSLQEVKQCGITCVAQASWLLLLLRAKADACRTAGAVAKSTACVLWPAKWCLSCLEGTKGLVL